MVEGMGSHNDVALYGLIGQCFKLKLLCILFIRRLFSVNDTG